MAKDTENARLYGDINSGVWVADIGTTAPAARTTTPGTGWVELGWMGEDGITESRDVDSDTKKAWQGGVTIRTVRSSDSRRFSFVCLETNAATAGIVRPGSTVTTTGGVTKTSVKAFTGTDERAWIIDVRDGKGINTRKVVPRGEVVEIGDVVYNGTDLTVFEITVECYPDSNGVLYDEYTDDPALAIEE